MSLKAILAAKKAAALAASQEASTVETKEVEDDQSSTNSPSDDGGTDPSSSGVLDSSSSDSVPSEGGDSVVSMLQDDDLVKPAPAASEKPLTFAEKLALKRGGIAEARVAPVVAKPVEIDPASIPEDPVTAADYVDIKMRIQALEEAFDDDLRGAMAELKAALKKNPNATELMLDADIGKMVIALRRMTHVEVVAAATKKPAAKKASKVKAKEVALTKEEIEAAFAEL